jgi:hypothetical protein
MAKAFETWTTLEHGPLEKHGDNLWSVRGRMPNPNISRRMTVARLGNGGLVIHNAVALDEPSMKEIEAFGEPAYLLVPNGFHRQDAFIYKQRYPKLRVLCPKAAVSKVKQVVATDGTYDEFPKDPRIQVFHMRGAKEREGALIVESETGTTATFCDAVINVPPRGGFFGFILGPTGRPAVPRISRWMVISKNADFRGHLEEIASISSLKRVIVGHGDPFEGDVSGTLRSVAAALGASVSDSEKSNVE